MRNESIVFKGINRHSFDNGTANGYCEELINVRSEDGQMKVVNPKVILSSVYYDDIIEHVYPAGKNYIGHKIANGYHVFEKFDISGTSSPVQINGSISSTHEVYYTCVNNFFVISDKTDISTIIYIFKDSSYSLFSTNTDILLSVSFEHTYMPYDNNDRYCEQEVSLDEIYSGETTSVEILESKLKKQNIKELMIAQKNKCISDKDGLYSDGKIIITITGTLWDGSEIQLSSYRTFELMRINDDSVLYGKPACIIRLVQGIGTSVDNWKLIADKYSYGGLRCSIISSNAAQYKNIFKYINIYSSLPYSNNDYDKNIILGRAGSGVLDTRAMCSFEQSILNDDKIGRVLMYHQKSFTINSIVSGNVSYNLKLSDDLSTNNKLDVLSQTKRAGKIFNYNKRLHFFDSSAKIESRSEYISSQFEDGTLSPSVDAYVFLRINQDIRVYKHNSIQIKTYTYGMTETIERLSLSPVFIYPDSRAYRVVFKNSSNKIVDLPLTSSNTYNYSYICNQDAFSTTIFDFSTNQSVISELSEYANCTTTIEYDEDTAINVTSQGNPIYFPVENSYSVDHRIVDLSIAFEEISAVQTGQYPVYIFTEKGIFALAQGVGDVLYASVVPVNADEVTGNVKQTRYGMVYISGGRIMLLSGRQSKCLSEYIDGEPDMDIRGLSGSSFNQCCCNNNLYNISQYLSKYPTGVSSNYLREFLSNAIINWSSSEDELIISSNGYDYSYVLNMTRNTWYKISSSYLKSSIPNIMLMKLAGATRSIVDYGRPSNNDATIHIQTRPIMLSPNQYTSVLRTILNAKAELSQSQLLSAYIFASDNCFDWICVAGAQKKGCTIKSIRLNRVNKSYRYHSIIIGGNVTKDTEITNMVVTIEDKSHNKLR